MSQQLYSITAYNKHDPFLGPFQYDGTASLSTGNITRRNTASGKDPSCLGRWRWEKFRGQGKASLRIETFYGPVPSAQGTGPGSVYSQYLIYFNSTNRIICPRQGLLYDVKEEVDIWENGDT